MLFYFDTIFFFGWCTTRSFVLLSSVLNSLCIIFRKNNLWNKNNEKKYETQKLRKNENYERMNEMQTRDDRNEMNEPTK